MRRKSAAFIAGTHGIVETAAIVMLQVLQVLMREILCRGFLLLEGLLKISSCLIECALRIVVGLQRLAIFVGCAFALSSDIEDFTQLNMAPNFGPSWLAVTV
jgi:hypothetical protein